MQVLLVRNRYDKYEYVHREKNKEDQKCIISILRKNFTACHKF